MKLFLRRLQSDWASWLAVAFIALLPFGRLSEIPLSVFAISLAVLARSAENRALIRSAASFVLPLFLCYWVPVFLSSLDSINPAKSWMHSLVALRFLAAALAMSLLLSTPSARERVLRWTAYLLLFWAFDAFIQLFFGRDLFGIAMHPDRLNALFIKKYQFFGPTLAMLSPLVLEHARRNWRPWAWAVSFALILGAVMIAGMRAGWLTMALVLATYMALMLKRENRELRRTIFTIPVLAVVVLAVSYFSSPLFQERINITRAFATGSEISIDISSMERVPIFTAALEMYRDHPVNGVGVRAFPAAYMLYAEPDDVHIRKSGGISGATHAHNVLLEIMSDTGTIGLAGLLAAIVFLLWHFQRTSPAERRDAFPFALAIGLILFPLNSHFAIYGTYTSSLIWFLVGLWSASLRIGPKMDPRKREALR
ncbi:MAG: O-antigen ligase family protein [Xanthomonadales bacterium]|nr:O-antigen ligase family protein [Gammaproteobacteria bacterium]NNK50796.1 O-antigen ligase family protein [Xanthomonadales bacterium]